MLNNDYVLIQLDRERKLRIGYKAIKTYKSKFGKSLTNIDTTNFDIEDVARIIYVGLIHEDNSLTFEQVEEMMDNISLKYAMEKMNEAITVAFGKNAQGTPAIIEKTESQ